MKRDARGNFVYHQPTTAGPLPVTPPEQVEQITAVREGCRELHALLETLPANRETALAVTKLEEVSMWANKSIVLGA